MLASAGKCWQVLGGPAEWAGLLDFVRSCQNLTEFDFRFHHALLPFGGGGFKRLPPIPPTPFFQTSGAILGLSWIHLGPIFGPSWGLLGPS